MGLSVRFFYYLKIKTNKKTKPYNPKLLNYNPVQFEKKLDRTVWSGLRLDRSYAYMHISNILDCGKKPYNDSILYP